MAIELLIPVPDDVLSLRTISEPQTIGNKLKIHSEKAGVPSFKNVQIAIVGVQETRSIGQPHQRKQNLKGIRKALYSLYIGNWNNKIIDLGDIPIGDKEKDSHKVLHDIAKEMYQRNILLIAFGGSQENTLGLCSVFNEFEVYYNLTSIDYKFDFGAVGSLISPDSYMSKLIANRPNYMTNFCNLGYQSYMVAQDEIDLMERLYFESIRLGTLTSDLKVVEPLMRDSDIVSMDMTAVKSNELQGGFTQVNGFTAQQFCALARYVGISDRVRFVGLCNIPESSASTNFTAQAVWYIIEGMHYRVNEYPFSTKENSVRYVVSCDDQELIFYQSSLSKRWWLEVRPEHDSNLESVLISCSEEDFYTAEKGTVPERWWKAIRRSII
jgi:hypothetical protein